MPDARARGRHLLALAGAKSRWARLRHRLGLTVSVWTVNNSADIEAMVDLGVDSIISDFPDGVRSVLAQRVLTVPPRIAAR